ncbi:MAG: hypothetical protein JWO67_686 [Streptosporangiaceae bacterium]|jgi:hypothetical protein|nr:hypothetical protein [Streptosporangiaceae bacterium]
MTKDQVWSSAVACAGSYADSPVLQLENLGARPRAMRDDQATQGRSVTSDIGFIAPTAHKLATEGGVSGPYPWRQPV